MPTTRRDVRLEGADNFRDLGGYPVPPDGHVRWQRLYRSASLHQLSSRDVALLRDRLDVGVVVDLRSRWELAAAPGVLGAHGVDIVQAPVRIHDRSRGERLLRSGELAGYYALLLEDAAPTMVEIVRRIAANSRATIVHCAAGKDRTGVVAATLLGVLGVPDEHIVADYAMTEQHRDRALRRLRGTSAYAERMRSLPDEALRAQPETMREVLEQLRADHGSMDGYLRAAGAHPDVLDELRAQLVENGP